MPDSDRKDQVIDLCRRLVRIPTATGEEGEAIHFLESEMSRLGYRTFIDDTGNLLGVIEGGKPGPRILLDSHVDTVPVSDESAWRVDPFGGDVVGGRLYGRGSSDMKGALAASIVAGESFAGGRDGFAGEVWISVTVAEEIYEGVAAREVERRVAPDLVVVGESTDLKLNRGGRGRAEVAMVARGRSAHSSNPSAGDNAVYKMVEAISAVRELELSRHPQLGRAIAELTDIKSRPYPGASVVPDFCRATYDRRLLPGEERDEVLRQFADAVSGVDGVGVEFVTAEATMWTGRRVSAERFFPAWLYPKDHPDLDAIRRALESRELYRGTGTYSFCTNAAHWAGVAGIPTFGYGPSKETLAHVDDEYIEVEELYEAYLGYEAILEGLLS
ncbi:MAG: YgeY family selenium metabolism-linked hydrolase [Bacillota bacterium]